MYVFTCHRCKGNISTEAIEGRCPHCGVRFEIGWQADLPKPKPPSPDPAKKDDQSQ